MSYEWICQKCKQRVTLNESDFPMRCCGIKYSFPEGVKGESAVRTPAAKEKPKPRTDCIHLGGELRRVECQTCAGKKEIKVLGCALHGECSIMKNVGVQTCQSCKDYRQPPANYTLADVTICVTSFIRFACLRRFITSARFYYPGLKIIVADQSGEHATGEDYEYCRNVPNVTWIDMPFDAGISNSRNAAVKAVETRLVCLLDDDHLFTEDSRLESLLDVLNADSTVSLVCGLLRMDNKVGNHGKTAARWFADFEKSKTTLNHLAITKPWQSTPSGTNYRKINRYINCFLAPKQVLADHPWDGVHKIANEHLDHCLLLWSSGLQAAYTPQCIFGEIHEDSPQYTVYRKRTSKSAMLNKWGISKQTGAQSMDAEPGIPDRQTVMPIPGPINIVLLTVGHTGSTMVAGLFGKLGWNLPDNDPEYNEPFGIRHAGRVWRHDGILPNGEALLKACSSPWLLKDPAFCETLDMWLGYLSAYRPLLLYLERDRASVETSWLRRGNDMELLARRYELADRHFAYWPWAKRRMRYEDVAAWVASFDLKRLGSS